MAGGKAQRRTTQGVGAQGRKGRSRGRKGLVGLLGVRSQAASLARRFPVGRHRHVGRERPSLWKRVEDRTEKDGTETQ